MDVAIGRELQAMAKAAGNKPEAVKKYLAHVAEFTEILKGDSWKDLVDFARKVGAI
jgi:hypothetical protein